MRTKRLIGVDVDLTVVHSDSGWLKWLISRPNSFDCQGFLDICKLPEQDMVFPYNLGELFPQVEDPHQYWREVDYSQFQPIEGSVQALQALSQYFGIVFISRIKGNHTKSKYYWLKEHFPFMTEYVATHGKWVMGNSVVAMFDDRKDVLEGFDFNKRIWFNTPYTQSSDCYVHLEFDRWNNNVVKMICDEYL